RSVGFRPAPPSTAGRSSPTTTKNETHVSFTLRVTARRVKRPTATPRRTAPRPEGHRTRSPNPRVAYSTEHAPAPTGRYSQAIEAGGLVFLAGQAPHDPDGNVPEAFEDQVRQCFANLAAVAAAAGTSLDRAVRVGVFISPRADA